MSENSWIILISVLVAILVVYVFLATYLVILKNEIKGVWFKILKLTRLRIDKVGRLVEVARQSGACDETKVPKLVKLHDEIWPIEELTPKKVDLGLEFNGVLQDFLAYASKTEAFMKESESLVLKTEFKENFEQIENLGRVLNELIRKYNGVVGNVLFLPLTSPLRLSKMVIFEFEG